MEIRRAAPLGMRCLHWETIAPGRAYHAALRAVPNPRADGYQFAPHNHDFYELMVVLEGDGLHTMNGVSAPLRRGDMVFIQPGDWHSLRYRAGSLLHYINIALPASVWERFVGLTQISLTDAALPSPAIVHLPDACFAEGTTAFRRALERFQATSGEPFAETGLEACRFLAAVAPLLLFPARGKGDGASGAIPPDAPPWLQRACRKLTTDEESLRRGLPDFIQESGVSRTHLARVLKSLTHQTPTEYINGLRLDRAARLLTTTTLPVLDVAGECGFEQAAYFYRLFRARFKTTPHAYRNAAGERVAPAFSLPSQKT